MPFIGWTIHTGLYATSSPVALWKLPATTEPASQAAAHP
jgi:hypothetical protein